MISDNQYFPRDDLRNTLVEQVFGVHRRPLPYMLASAIVEQPLMSGQFFSLRQDENGNIVVIDQRNSIVALIKANVATVLDFVDGSLNSIVGFAPASVSLDDRTARIIIMRRS